MLYVVYISCMLYISQVRLYTWLTKPITLCYNIEQQLFSTFSKKYLKRGTFSQTFEYEQK